MRRFDVLLTYINQSRYAWFMERRKMIAFIPFRLIYGRRAHGRMPTSGLGEAGGVKNGILPSGTPPHFPQFFVARPRCK